MEKFDVNKKADEENEVMSDEKSPKENQQGESKPTRKNAKLHFKRMIISCVASLILFSFFALQYNNFSDLLKALIFTTSVGVITLTFVSLFKNFETIYKLSVTVIYIGAVTLVGTFIMYKTGIMEKIGSIEQLINYINNSGGVAEVIFVTINFLQVTIIPIPSSITTTAGALLFEGIWKPLYLTVIGLVLGSMFAFFLGRVFGVKFANWLIGEKAMNKYHKITKGKDKIVLFYMFIFPFFPDDFLCILAGMTNYTYVGFFFLQIVSRLIGTLSTILITKGIISIPLHGWWLLLWGFLILCVITFLIITIKYSEKIEQKMMKLINKITFGFSSRRKKKATAVTEETNQNIAIEDAIEEKDFEENSEQNIENKEQTEGK